jgi:hypothetical protein
LNEPRHPERKALGMNAGAISNKEEKLHFRLSLRTVPGKLKRVESRIAMAEAVESQSVAREEPRTASSARFRWLNWSSLFLAFLQSVCSMFIALHGVRLLIGIGAVVLASGAWHLAEQLHVNAIRIPMMLIALAGALLNLLALWQVRRLRRRSASGWRQQPLTSSKRRSEALQLALSVLTLVLLIAEEAAHLRLKGVF